MRREGSAADPTYRGRRSLDARSIKRTLGQLSAAIYFGLLIAAFNFEMSNVPRPVVKS